MTHQEHDLIASASPSGVDARSDAIRDRGGVFRLDKERLAVAVKLAEAEGLWVDAKGETAIRPLPGVALDELLACLELASGEVAMIFLYVQLRAELFDGLLGGENLEHRLHVVTLPRLSQQILAHEVTRIDKELERREGSRDCVDERRVNRLNVALEHVVERTRGEHRQFQARAVVEGGAHIGVHRLYDLLLERVLRRHVRALVGRAGPLDADTRTTATQALQALRVLRRADLGDFTGSAAQRLIIRELWANQGVAKDRALFHDGAGDDTHARGEGATVEDVHKGRTPRYHVGDVPQDAIGIPRSEVNGFRDGDAVTVGQLRAGKNLDLIWFHCKKWAYEKSIDLSGLSPAAKRFSQRTWHRLTF